jgi:OmpA-OmpF porin, OOP family
MRRRRMLSHTKTPFMKKLLLVVCAFTFVSTLVAQETSNKKSPTLVINFMFNDFRTPTLFRTGSLASVINKQQFSKFTDMDPGISVTYIHGVYSKLDFAATLGGSFVRYPFKNQGTSASESFLVEADANVNLRLLEDNYIVNPYLIGGVGASYYNSHYAAYMPLGTGLQFKVGPEEVLRVEAQYRLGVSESASNHFNFSIGFGLPISSKKK